MDFQTWWRRFKKRTKKRFKKIVRFIKRYIRFLVRHTKAKDYSVLFYTIVGFIVLIIFLVLLGNLFSSIGGKKKKKIVIPTTATPTEATEDPAVVAHRELVARAESIYNANPNLLVLVNNDRELSPTYSFTPYTLNSGYEVSDAVVNDLTQFLEACNNAGHEYDIISAYRSREDQDNALTQQIQEYIDYDGMSEEEARTKALQTIQQPGHSEHETGLALDMCGYGYETSDDFDDTEETTQWMIQNCTNFGFILRYPKGKEGITGINYEPWHFRYVGREAAAFMKENDLTLEEFYTLIGK